MGSGWFRPVSHTWSPVPGGVTAPNGFLAAGITAGLKASGRPDLALLLAPPQAVCAGTFTTTVVRAACVDLCAERLRSSGGRARAVLINSGQANACTGSRGLADSLTATAALAERLALPAEDVLLCSTGVIGVPIPMEILLAGLDPLVAALHVEGGAAAARAILTTDLVEKEIALEARLDGRLVRIGGMAKGSGMIHPAMATMLAFLSCDVGVPAAVWRQMVRRVVERSFNAISVDGDTSTNDTFLAFAAGEPLPPEHFDALEAGLTAVAQQLARAIARDGEGATCLIEARVEGASDEAAARAIARTICASSLVKCAIHGRDPNWGRIVAAAGRAGVPFDPNTLALWLGEHQLLAAGQPLAFDRRAASSYMGQRATAAYLDDDTVLIRLVVGTGAGEGRAWGCDLSAQYVRINADYTT
ncbi:MAG: bifunctional glutamate N-acetyltransferase/amino-acid acetyltransferase ArgJ [Cyanobacteriota bacterium]|jgi:glutamate N-acetyltransferase/amino-acid N-acetyltransferase